MGCFPSSNNLGEWPFRWGWAKPEGGWVVSLFCSGFPEHPGLLFALVDPRGEGQIGPNGDYRSITFLL